LICGEYVQDQTGFSSDEMELQSFLVFLILHYQKHPGIGAVLAAIGLILVFLSE
jgi:hypothetical protein